VHVDDFTLGALKAVTAETKSGEVYYIAESQSYPYRELVELLGKAVGKKGFPLRLPGGLVRGIAAVFEAIVKAFGGAPMFTREKANEILEDWEVSIEKAKNDLDYISQYSFADGSRETVQWYRERGWL